LLLFLLFVEGEVPALGSASISNFSHLGGLYTGIFPALNILPYLKKEKWEVVLLFVGVFSTFTEFIILPIIYFVAIAPTVLLVTCSTEST